MERHLDEELTILNNDLLKMATLTEDGIQKAIEALKGQDAALAEEVIEADQNIDELENQIEEAGIELLALFQPMAKDLRFITTGMRISTELERISDLAVNICQRVIEIGKEPLIKPLVDIPSLGENSRKMVTGAIDAFVKKDIELARKIILTDKKSNDLRTAIIEELINDYLKKDPSTAQQAVALILVARDLERISDHAASIAEDVIYMIEAKVVKHHLEELIPSENTPKDMG